MKTTVYKVSKSCANCKNNVEYPPPHTCDECDSLDAPEWFMWEPNFKMLKKKVCGWVRPNIVASMRDKIVPAGRDVTYGNPFKNCK